MATASASVPYRAIISSMSCTFSMRALLIFIAIFIGTRSAVSAGVLTDQRYDDIHCLQCSLNMTVALAEGYAFVGQTVTAGISGNLVEVDIFAARRIDFTDSWQLEIVHAPDGIPNGVHLASSQLFLLPEGVPETWTTVAIPLQPFVSAGQTFAVLLHPHGVSGLNPGLFAGTWSGAANTFDAYPGGSLVFGGDLNSLIIGASEQDLYFRTRMSAVPEPGTMCTAFAVLATLAWILSRWPGLPRTDAE